MGDNQANNSSARKPFIRDAVPIYDLANATGKEYLVAYSTHRPNLNLFFLFGDS